MLIFNVNQRRVAVKRLRQAAAMLRQGGVLVYPTDTAYALGGCYDNPAVVRRVLEIKGRRDRKFTLIAASTAQVERFFPLPPAARRVCRRYWPGPVSIVVSRRFAVRVPSNRVARQLARLAGAPLIATSANRSGGVTPYSAYAAVRQFGRGRQPDAVVDAGRLPKRKPSTVVAVNGRGKLRIVRSGAASLPSVKRKALNVK